MHAPRFRHAPGGWKNNDRLEHQAVVIPVETRFGTLRSAHRAVVRSRHRGVSCPVAGLGLTRIAPDAPTNITLFRGIQDTCGTTTHTFQFSSVEPRQSAEMPRLTLRFCCRAAVPFRHSRKKPHDDKTTSRDLSTGPLQRIDSAAPQSDIVGNLEDGCCNTLSQAGVDFFTGYMALLKRTTPDFRGKT